MLARAPLAAKVQGGRGRGGKLGRARLVVADGQQVDVLVLLGPVVACIGVHAPLRPVVTHPQRQLGRSDGVQRHIGTGVAATAVAVGKRRAQAPIGHRAPVVNALDFKAINLGAWHVHGLEDMAHGTALGAHQARVLDQVAVTVVEADHIQAQALQATTQAQLHAPAALGLQMGVGDDAVLVGADIQLEAVVELPGLGRAVATGVLAKNAPLRRDAVEHAQLGQHGRARHVACGLRGRGVVQVLVLYVDAKVVDAQPRRDGPVPEHGFILHVQAHAGFVRVGKALERKSLRRQRVLSGVQVADAAVHVVQPIHQAVRHRSGPGPGAQHLVGLQAQLPGGFFKAVVADAVRGRQAGVGHPAHPAVAHALGRGALHRHHGAQVIGPRRAQTKTPIPGKTAALHAAVCELIADVVHAAFIGPTAGEQVGVLLFLRMLQGEDMALLRAGAPDQLAQQRCIALILRIGLRARVVGGIVVAHGAHFVGLAAAGREHPLHLFAGLGRHRTGHGGAVVFLVPPQRHPPAHGLGTAIGMAQEIAGLVADKVDHPGHAIATVLRRGRAPYQLDALERLQREVLAVEHGRARHIAARHADAIDRHQHAIAAQAANLDAHIAVARKGIAAGPHRQACRAAAHLGVGQVLQRLAQVAALLIAQCAFADDIGRQRQIVVGRLKARAADHHRGQGGMRLAGDSGLGLGLGATVQPHQGQAQTQVVRPQRRKLVGMGARVHTVVCSEGNTETHPKAKAAH